ncbi:MAG TPA: hypothetical protein DGG94_05155 [Micromonosporaceae bacterium]|nr:hypothetical protein [Micromonosporaceae bacterium]
MAVEAKKPDCLGAEEDYDRRKLRAYLDGHDYQYAVLLKLHHEPMWEWISDDDPVHAHLERPAAFQDAYRRPHWTISIPGELAAQERRLFTGLSAVAAGSLCTTGCPARRHAATWCSRDRSLATMDPHATALRIVTMHAQFG